ncbi:MAG: hypothetical protein C0598_08240 [Marinilabiliales bacterium]|nr:MAG: hypothetical protein C0598_08240 [Marinilabiliales bacterium]
MGIGFTIDTPLKVSKYGIDSVISLVDDVLLEKIRKSYSEKLEIPFQEISNKIDDFRAKRITSYLNFLNEQAEQKFEEFKNVTLSKKNELKDYFNSLPDSSDIKKEFQILTEKYFNLDEIKSWLKENLQPGSIDVNIMTKVDKDNYSKGEKLPVEFNDAHAALRGYANSNLKSSIILSAGMNPRLYAYIENFDDFFPDENGEIKKKIVLKVSDYRSALIQGKFFAKKGLWVSEYRIESGLNCGGHAFATEGYLMGPILEEFKNNRKDLIQSVNQILIKALENKGRTIPKQELALKITAQGGVGTAEEHNFLMDHYGIDSVGWGTPFLLVPEATSVDEPTIDKLIQAKEEDLYLSNISPLGVPFNSLRGNTKDLEKLTLISEGKPGSKCPKRYVALDSEFHDKGLCTASSTYQKKKLKQLEESGVTAKDYFKKFREIVDKGCICVGLGTSALIANDIETDKEGPGVSVCPSPNLAYFSKKMNLRELVDHIYGRSNVISRNDRPNMFIKELKIYIDYLKEKFEDTKEEMTQKQEKYFVNFSENLQNGINYYNDLFSNAKDKFTETKEDILNQLTSNQNILKSLSTEIRQNCMPERVAVKND